MPETKSPIPLRAKTADAEKITINLGYVDLGQIDLLVSEGFYSNRTDFIRTAIRNQVDRHGEAARQSVSRRNLDLGLRNLTREELEAAREKHQPLTIRVLGLVTIAADVTADLARAAWALTSRGTPLSTDTSPLYLRESDAKVPASLKRVTS